MNDHRDPHRPCNVARHHWVAVAIVALAGSALAAASGPAAADRSPAPQEAHQVSWCNDTSLLPHTADAAEAWLGSCKTYRYGPGTADAAEGWLG